MAEGLVFLSSVYLNGYVLRGGRNVPQSAHIQHRSRVQLDGIQRVIESDDVENHARGGPHILAPIVIIYQAWVYMFFGTGCR